MSARSHCRLGNFNVNGLYQEKNEKKSDSKAAPAAGTKKPRYGLSPLLAATWPALANDIGATWPDQIAFEMLTFQFVILPKNIIFGCIHAMLRRAALSCSVRAYTFFQR